MLTKYLLTYTTCSPSPLPPDSPCPFFEMIQWVELGSELDLKLDFNLSDTEKSLQKPRAVVSQ